MKVERKCETLFHFGCSSSSSFFFCTLIFQFTSHKTYTWRIQSHTRKNSIVRNDIISNELSGATVRLPSLSYKLIWLNRHANTSQQERERKIRTFSFSFIDYICVYQGQMNRFSSDSFQFRVRRVLTVWKHCVEFRMESFVGRDYCNQHSVHDRNKQMDKRQSHVVERIGEHKYYTWLKVGSSSWCEDSPLSSRVKHQS